MTCCLSLALLSLAALSLSLDPMRVSMSLGKESTRIRFGIHPHSIHHAFSNVESNAVRCRLGKGSVSVGKWFGVG